TRRTVHLDMDDRVDLYAAKQIAMNTLVMLRHYRVTDLREVTISDFGELSRTGDAGALTSGTPGAVYPNARSVRERTGENGSKLWFNSRLFSTEAGDSHASWLAQAAKEGAANRSSRLGVAAVVAHEIGHLIGNAARRSAAERGKDGSLAREVIRQVAHTSESHAIQNDVAARYKADFNFFSKAPDNEVLKWHRKNLEKAGNPEDVAADPSAADVRAEQLAGLPGKYYGPTAMNELSKALVHRHSGPYAAENQFEQEAEGIMAVVVDGPRADAASRATHAFVMQNLGRPANDRPKDFHKYNERIVVDNRAQKAAENATRQRANAARPGNPWLSASPATFAATGHPPRIPPMPVHPPDVHLTRQQGHAQAPPQQSLTPDAAPTPRKLPGQAAATAGLQPVRPVTAAPAPQRPTEPGMPGIGQDVVLAPRGGNHKHAAQQRSLLGPGGGVRP
ncbi:MAG TPA: hypothetical protein VLH10_18300, partial [Yinghuangia sp.]|nr:hypothetical protein [Yinghuangia sp.]